MSLPIVLGTCEYAWISNANIIIRVLDEYHEDPDNPESMIATKVQNVILQITYELQDANGKFITNKTDTYPVHQGELLDTSQILSIIQNSLLTIVSEDKKKYTGVDVVY